MEKDKRVTSNQNSGPEFFGIELAENEPGFIVGYIGYRNITIEQDYKYETIDLTCDTDDEQRQVKDIELIDLTEDSPEKPPSQKMDQSDTNQPYIRRTSCSSEGRSQLQMQDKSKKIVHTVTNQPYIRRTSCSSEGQLQRHSASQQIGRPATTQPNIRGKGCSSGFQRMSIEDQRRQLPIFGYKMKLKEMIDKYSVIVVIGETGSGKSTQLPQYLAEWGYCKNGKVVACTQPRRVSATSLARRVSKEMKTFLGRKVGYNIRFDNRTSNDTIIQYMTDGMLLKEKSYQGNSNLNKYSCIIVDEAHERTITTDILISLLKNVIANRPEFRLIITSATIDAEKFSTFFNNAPIIHIPGKMFDITVHYLPEQPVDVVHEIIEKINDINKTQPAGDILVFMDGQEEITRICKILEYDQDLRRICKRDNHIPEMLILPMYGALSDSEQSHVFCDVPQGQRKVVVSTNIAETSITIDGIVYVVDAGYVKHNIYDPVTETEHLDSILISQAAADQRKGRAGRTREGHCFRIYTEETYNKMDRMPIPEIMRENLLSTILLLKSLGIDNPFVFDFIDTPPRNALLSAFRELFQIGALNREGAVTSNGLKFASFPIDPMLSKILFASAAYNCSEEMLTIVSLMSLTTSGPIFQTPRADKQKWKQAHRQFMSDGDHCTLLNVYNQWNENYSNEEAWAKKCFINLKPLREAYKIREQLSNIMEKIPLKFNSSANDSAPIRKSLCAGLFRRVAKHSYKNEYITLHNNQCVGIHESCCLYDKEEEWVVYHQIRKTSNGMKIFIVTPIEKDWLIEMAPEFISEIE